MIHQKPGDLEIICRQQDAAEPLTYPQCLIELLAWNDIINAELTMTAREVAGEILHAC